MTESIQLLSATVGHERFTPRKNSFQYKVFYVAYPVLSDGEPHLPTFFSLNRWNIFSFHTRDHGPKDGSPWRTWVVEECVRGGITVHDDDSITLIAHPRLFGYAFNPISYWIVENQSGVKAVLCEVHNTFGDDHNYLLAHEDARPFQSADLFHAKKHLYVSPFNTMHGRYTFTFERSPERFASVINYYENDVHILNTYMGGTLCTLTPLLILKSCIMYPLMTLMVVYRIHWQAVRLYIKGVVPTLYDRPPHTSKETTKGHE